jgi:hypothetical protein
LSPFLLERLQIARQLHRQLPVLRPTAVSTVPASRMFSTEDHSELLNSEREAMPYDVVIVGAG